jgi:hypothetical protein
MDLEGENIVLVSLKSFLSKKAFQRGAFIATII